MTFIFALQLKSLDEESVVGKISKQWSGLVREAFTDADNFGIQFPLDLDVKMKAVMLGACFLIVSLFPLVLFIGGFLSIIPKSLTKFLYSKMAYEMNKFLYQYSPFNLV